MAKAMERILYQFRHLVGILSKVSFFDEKFYFKFFYDKLNVLDQLRSEAHKDFSVIFCTAG